MVKKVMIPLSNEKVQSALGVDTKIIKYSDLKDYETIKDLLPNVNDFVVILLEDDLNHGHWTALIHSKDGYYYFNSYGEKYDDDLSIIPRCIRRILGQDRKEITRLLDGGNCQWNAHKFQANKSQCCGRYVVLACTMITKMLYTPKDFEQFLLDKSKEFKEPTDNLVAKWVNI
jgi:hypothetical protein